jgi:fatty acid desaturase
MRKPDSTINTRYLAKRSDGASAARVVVHLAAVATPLVLIAVLPLGVHDGLLVATFAVLMNGMLNLMHAAAHHHVFLDRGANMWLGKSVLGPMFFANFDSYRRRHWEHHKHLGDPEDTKDAYLVDIRGPRLFVYLVRCLTGVEALRKFTSQFQGTVAANDDQADGPWLLRLAIFQSGVIAVLFMAAFLARRNLSEAVWMAAGTYVFGYVYGVMSITIFVATLRAIAEHQRTSFDIVAAGRASLRNFRCSWLSRLVFGSYGFGEHLTHHEYPAIPYYRLPAATSELAAIDADYRPAADYPQVLLDIVKGR